MTQLRRVSTAVALLFFVQFGSSTSLTSYETATYRDCIPGELDPEGVFNCDCEYFVATDDEYVALGSDGCFRAGTSGNNCRYRDQNKKQKCKRQDIVREFQYTVENGEVDQFMSESEGRSDVLADMTGTDSGQVSVMDSVVVADSDMRRRLRDRRNLRMKEELRKRRALQAAVDLTMEWADGSLDLDLAYRGRISSYEETLWGASAYSVAPITYGVHQIVYGVTFKCSYQNELIAGLQKTYVPTTTDQGFAPIHYAFVCRDDGFFEVIEAGQPKYTDDEEISSDSVLEIRVVDDGFGVGTVQYVVDDRIAYTSKDNIWFYESEAVNFVAVFHDHPSSMTDIAWLGPPADVPTKEPTMNPTLNPTAQPTMNPTSAYELSAEGEECDRTTFIEDITECENAAVSLGIPADEISDIDSIDDLTYPTGCVYIESTDPGNPGAHVHSLYFNTADGSANADARPICLRESGLVTIFQRMGMNVATDDKQRVEDILDSADFPSQFNAACVAAGLSASSQVEYGGISAESPCAQTDACEVGEEHLLSAACGSNAICDSGLFCDVHPAISACIDCPLSVTFCSDFEFGSDNCQLACALETNIKRTVTRIHRKLGKGVQESRWSDLEQDVGKLYFCNDDMHEPHRAAYVSWWEQFKLGFSEGNWEAMFEIVDDYYQLYEADLESN